MSGSVRLFAIILALLCSLLLFSGCGGEKSPEQSSSVSHTGKGYSEGTYLVGTDIPAGLYTVALGSFVKRGVNGMQVPCTHYMQLAAGDTLILGSGRTAQLIDAIPQNHIAPQSIGEKTPYVDYYGFQGQPGYALNDIGRALLTGRDIPAGGYFVVTEEDCPAFRINRHPGNLNICPDFEKTWDDPHSYPTDRDPLVVTLMEEDILSGQMIDLFPLKTRPIPFSGGNSPTPDADGYYPAGRYLVGIDLPAGEYCIQSTNVNTPGNYWFEHSLYEGKFAPTGCGRQCWQMVQDGDILGVENARLIPIQSAPEVKPDENGYYHSGEYRVGIDLPTGIYQLHMEPVGTAVVYENARHNSKGRLDYFHGETITRYLELGEGEILRLEQASVLSAEKAPPAARNADGSYPPGMYLVGYDIPAGAYCISADGGSSYRYDVDHTTRREEYDDEPLFSDRSIEPGHAYFILDEGTYLILRSGALKPADEVCFPIDPNKEQLSGWYRIDTDIPAGKYRFTAEETYYELYLTDKPQGNPFFLDQILLEQSDILTLEKGKYLYAKHVTIEKQ